MNRARMDIRDQKDGGLTPEDVGYSYFERDGLDVIYPIRFDELGNVKDAPPGYRRFFMEETTRSIGL